MDNMNLNGWKKNGGVMYLQKATLQISFQAFDFEVFKLIYGCNDTFHLRKRQRKKNENWTATRSFFSSI